MMPKHMRPKHAVLVRHFESEGNLANKLSRAGDHSHFTPEFEGRHSTHFRLVKEKKEEQAVAARAWLREHGFVTFGRYLVSEYTRAIESAASLELPDAAWELDFRLRERDHGHADVLATDKIREQYAMHLAHKERHRLYWSFPEGETLAHVCDRVENVLNGLNRDTTCERVIIVSHNETMRALRIVLEGQTANEYHAGDCADKPDFRIGNGQIIHYTRVDPADPTHILPHFGWVRSVNPTQPEYAGHDWRAIVRKRYSNADLLALAELSPRLIEG